VYAIGVNLARLHHFTRENALLKNLQRPVYGSEKIDSTLEELRYGVEADIYSLEHYEIMAEVLAQVKGFIRELNSQEGAWGLIHADIQLGNIVITESGEPCFIDFCLSGYGHYLFDIGSASTIFESKQRDRFLKGYSSHASFSRESLRYVEGLILLDVFLCYTFFIRDADRNDWIKDHVIKKIELWKEWLAGKEIFYIL
jgi:Ser/Thr protein kinase RdoA (MazF antagonist)